MKEVLAIVGPTASGKTKLAVAIAEKLNGEIISADSRQIYKNIPIATAQPSDEELKSVKHYFVNELELTEEFNAGEFGKKGRKIIEDIIRRGKLPIIAGGSGLYIKSLIDGFFESDTNSNEVRMKLYSDLNLKGEEYLYKELEKIDPVIFQKIPKGKIRRVIRALEVYYTSGRKMSDLQKENAEINFTVLQYGLMIDRKKLYDRINKRVYYMIDNGLIKEVENLLKMGYHYKTNYSLDTVGIKEVIKYIEGEIDFEKMKELIKQNSRRYAKRQMTWFRRDERIKWINKDEFTENIIIEILISEFNKFKKTK